MKKLFLGSLLAVCTLLMTSCLGEGSNQSSGVGYGVIDYSDKTFKPIIKTGGVPFYSPEVENFVNKGEANQGDCCIFAYTLDGDIPQNSNESVAANGYYTITVSQYGDIKRHGIQSSLRDTAVIVPNEMLVTSIDMSNTGLLIDKGVKMLFLATVHEDIVKDQKQEFNMSYAMDQEPEVINGANVYNLFLRVEKTAGDKGTTSTQALMNAFDMTNFITSLQYKEEQNNKKELKFRINFANELNADSTKITWKASDVLTYTFPTEE